MTARNSLVRMGLQIPNFTYPGVGPDDLFERISLIATTAEVLPVPGMPSTSA